MTSVSGMLSESIAWHFAVISAAAGFVFANSKNVTTTIARLESVLSNFIESPNHLQLVRLLGLLPAVVQRELICSARYAGKSKQIQRKSVRSARSTACGSRLMEPMVGLRLPFLQRTITYVA